MSLLYALLFPLVQADTLLLHARLAVTNITVDVAGDGVERADANLRRSLAKHVERALAKKLELAPTTAGLPQATLRMTLDDRDYAVIPSRHRRSGAGPMMLMFHGQLSLLFADGHSTPPIECHLVGNRQMSADEFNSATVLRVGVENAPYTLTVVGEAIHGVLEIFATRDARCAGLLAGSAF